jgi:hypothetical protein
VTDAAQVDPFGTGMRPLCGVPFWQVPILINSFNRLHSLRRLMNWLLRAGYANLYIIDNASSYPPLLRYLSGLEQNRQAKVIRLAENAVHLAIWRQSLLDWLEMDTEYVYTDPDVVPVDACPRDLVGVLQSALIDNPDIAVAGLGLLLDDLPDTYRYKSHAVDSERRFWLRPAASGLFQAPIDTTLALFYRPKAGHSAGHPAIRSGWPYLAAHEGWYLNHAQPTEEDLFYCGTAGRGTSHWSAGEVPAWLQKAAAAQASRLPCLLHVGRAGPRLPGYLGVPTDGRVPLADHVVDGIYVDSSLERLVTDAFLAKELHRVAKPGARMVLHPRLVTAGQMLDVLGQNSQVARGWQLDRVTVVPNGALELRDACGLVEILHRRPTVVRRIMAHLHAATDGEARRDQPVVSVGEIDRWDGFVAVADDNPV